MDLNTGTFPLDGGLFEISLADLKASCVAWFDTSGASTTNVSGVDKVNSISNATGDTNWSLIKQSDASRPALIAAGPNDFPAIYFDTTTANKVLKLSLSGGATFSPAAAHTVCFVCRAPYSTISQSLGGRLTDSSHFTYYVINGTQEFARMRMGTEDATAKQAGEAWTRLRRGTTDAEFCVLWFSFDGTNQGRAATNGGPVSSPTTIPKPSDNAAASTFCVGGHSVTGSGAGTLWLHSLIFFDEDLLADPSDATRVMWGNYFKHVVRIRDYE